MRNLSEEGKICHQIESETTIPNKPQQPPSLPPLRPNSQNFIIVTVLSRTAGSVLFALSARRMSHSLHDGMIRHAVGSPIPFFDATPRGRILNRFTADIDGVDSRMYLFGKMTIQNALLTVAKLAVVGTEAPLVVAVGLVALAILVFVMVSSWVPSASNELTLPQRA